jgi:hypothetical protein
VQVRCEGQEARRLRPSSANGSGIGSRSPSAAARRLRRRSTVSPYKASSPSRQISSRSVAFRATGGFARGPAARPPLSRWPSRIAGPSARRASSSRPPPKLENSACAIITRPGASTADPIAVQRHLDAALGAEIGVGLPGDVGEQAGGEAQPAHRGSSSNSGAIQRRAGRHAGRSDARPAGLARRLDQRIERRARLGLSSRVEQAFADAEGRDDQLARLELVDQQVEQHRAHWARSRGARGRRGFERLGIGASPASPELARPAGLHPILWVIGSG